MSADWDDLSAKDENEYKCLAKLWLIYSML